MAQRRHLLSGSTVIFSLQTTDSATAASVGALLNSPASFSSTLEASLMSVLPTLTALQVELPTTTQLRLAAVPCLPGTFFDPTTQSCTPCEYGKVSIANASVSCAACPPRNAWFNASLCVACPANAVTSPTNLGQCVCSFGYYDLLFSASLTAPACATCPQGGVCTIGLVGAAKGYWRESTSSDVFYRCRENRCVEEALIEPLSSSAPGRRLLSANTTDNCVPGAAGPLCAVCQPRFSMQSGACAPCDPAQAFSAWSVGRQSGLIVGCGFFGVVAIAFVFLLPLLPLLESSVEAVSARASAAAAAAKQRALAVADSAKMTVLARVSWVQQLKRSPKSLTDEVDAPSDVTASLDQHSQLTAERAAGYVLATASAEVVADESGAQEDDVTPERDTVSGLVESVGIINGLLESISSFFNQLSAAWVRYGKILINFYQIVSTFLKSLSVPWPRSFVTAMARVSVINLNLAQLPKTACLNPNPSYYSLFNGYTFGLLFFLLFVASLRFMGEHSLSRLTLRSLDDKERSVRLQRFHHGILIRVLFVLYLVYPGVSVAIFGIFSCTRVSSGVAYLNEDVRIVCYTAKHNRYLIAGVIWVVVFTIGIPVFFMHLLYKYKVPQLAGELADNAWLREAVKVAVLEGLAAPADEDLAQLTTENIAENHLEALYAFFVRCLTPESAAAILAGDSPPLPIRAGEKESVRLTQALSSALQYLGVQNADEDEAEQSGVASHRIASCVLVRPLRCPLHDDDAQDRRATILKQLLRFAKTSGTIAIPAIHWVELEKDKAEKTVGRSLSKLQASPKQEALREAALENVGFLFEAYTPQCYYWEVVELGRKLALTSILALITPGTAGQVVVGLLLAFFMLQVNTHFQPYAEMHVNQVNVMAQLNLTLFLLVALLLRVNLDDQSQAGFFSGIVGFLSVFPVALPVLLKIYDKVTAGEEGEGALGDSGFEELGGGTS